MADINIASIRTKYPQYADLSDQQLADALHTKYYSDMPKDEFYQKINFNPDTKAPAPKSGASSAFDKAKKQTENLASRLIPTHPKQDVRDVAQGVVEAPLALTQNVERLKDKATPSALKDDSTLKSLVLGALGLPQDILSGQDKQDVLNTDIEKYTSPIGSGRTNLASQLLRGAGQTAIPIAGEDAQISEIASLMPKSPKVFSSILGRLLSGAEIGSTVMPEKNIDEMPEDALRAALLNAGVGTGIEVGANILERLRPSKALRGTLSPAELKANLEAAKGTKTALPDVVASSGLKKLYENVIAKLPFSGASKQMEQLLSQTGSEAEKALMKVLGMSALDDAQVQLSSEGESALKDIFGTDLNPETATKDLVEHIQDKFSDEKSIKNQDYVKRNEIAENDPNFKMEAPKFSEAVNEHAGNISDLTLLKYEPGVAKLFNKLTTYKGPYSKGLPEDTANKITKVPTISEAQRLKAKLNTYSKIAKNSSDAEQRQSAHVYKDLATKLNEDIHDSIKKSGNKELAAQQAKADENYAKNFAPFLNDAIFKYANGIADPDTIVNSLIKTGGDADRSTLLSAGTQLPGDTRKLLGNAYFSRAIDKMTGELDPKKLDKLITKLGPNQFKELVPEAADRKKLIDFHKRNELVNQFAKSISSDGNVNNASLATAAEKLLKQTQKSNYLLPKESQAELRKFKTLQGMNKDLTKNIANLPTGRTLLDLVPIVLGAAGHVFGGPLGAALGIGAGSAAGRTFTKLLTSEKIREAVVKAMLKNETKFKGGGPLTKTAQVLTQAANSSGGQ